MSRLAFTQEIVGSIPTWGTPVSFSGKTVAFEATIGGSIPSAGTMHQLLEVTIEYPEHLNDEPEYVEIQARMAELRLLALQAATKFKVFESHSRFVVQ